MTSHDNLENQLDQYRAAVWSACGRSKLRAWAPYAAAFGSAMALTTSAEASIVYSGIQNVQVTTSDGPIHMVLAGPENFYLFGNNAFETKAGAILGTGIEVKRLASGDAISAGAGSFGGHQYLTNWGHGLGFAGVSFQIGGQTHYGWVRLDPTPTGDTAVDWAYNSDVGGSILAGQESSASSTPEPGTLPLTLLAAGASGVLALRNRRKTRAAPAQQPASN